MNTAVTLRQLGFLVAVADTLNFSRAAEACFVTQPSLSAGLKELEDRLGVVLAERTKRSVLLTPIGAVIAERARALLLAAQEIEALAAAEGAPDSGDLRLGAIPTIGPYLIPRALPEIRRVFPKLRLLLREEMTEQLLDGLQRGRLDLILFALPFEADGLETIELFEDGYHLAAPPGSFGPEPVRGAQLDGARLMLLERGHCLQRHALSAFPDRNIEQDESFSATSLPTLISMVSEGLGITLLPDLALDAGVIGGQDVAIAPLPDACPRRVVLAWRTTSARAALFRRLGDIFRRTRALVGPSQV
ncbi:LysR family hydrogen peroxide-inducible transcriptional activator [Rhodopseudomonas thermotolerans]|uniref:LysR family hydrogen peroxide-inducible transcriptional activator n=2 Tax=Rhodopseudomonas TaxID=1073 RepID=A0A336JYW1_9BRAD|nr:MULTISPECIES: hydrogen peroxide-inducible genes activator [Rhodopseudomonas]RED21725.1 LysR family hydrogen peroxide-inducible transcriptional activator [Rhodopseudomonas pentothenatexigens]REF88633.1 LysR family hydrogen peroxide-inducible transcriptional activator [Rhodopseudomonas thermotolerans]SSW93606.1 LysR family hydrogen peroxide-inducible transcriptional activator [Rhodopseudomonas pentothenatexigens]